MKRIIEIKFRNKNPSVIDFYLKSDKVANGRIITLDKYKKDTKYNDIKIRLEPNKEVKLKLKLPVHPIELVVLLNFDYDNINYYYEINKLSQDLNKVKLTDKEIEFINFALFFAENHKVLKTNEIYHSDSGNFHLKYVDKITNSTTPARINCTKNMIEVSYERIKDLTIQQIFLILLHEFSHCHRNKDSSDEIEADMNAVRYYFAMNFSENEAQVGLAKVFYRKPTELNYKRYNIVKNFFKKQK